jgi:hypothetical protein
MGAGHGSGTSTRKSRWPASLSPSLPARTFRPASIASTPSDPSPSAAIPTRRILFGAARSARNGISPKLPSASGPMRPCMAMTFMTKPAQPRSGRVRNARMGRLVQHAPPARADRQHPAR